LALTLSGAQGVLRTRVIAMRRSSRMAAEPISFVASHLFDIRVIAGVKICQPLP
jgi:hypothetical protein